MAKDVSLLPYLNALLILEQHHYLALLSKELMEYAKLPLQLCAQIGLARTMQQKLLQLILNVTVISRDA